MDIAMPLLNGIEATRQIKKKRPQTKVIILSMHSHDRFISELFTLGASGYLLKDSRGPDIIQAIESAIEGDTYLSLSISRKVIEDYVSLKKTRSSREELYSKLPNREREVFQMIAEGRSTKEIAEILFVSVSTVKSHRANIMEKLEIDNLSQLIHFAIDLVRKFYAKELPGNKLRGCCNRFFAAMGLRSLVLPVIPPKEHRALVKFDDE